MRCCAENLSSWQPVRLSPPEDLRFTYEEEEFPEDFFVPYVWSIVVSNTTIPWNLQAVALFQPVALKAEDRSASGRSSSQTDEAIPGPVLETVNEV